MTCKWKDPWWLDYLFKQQFFSEWQEGRPISHCCLVETAKGKDTIWTLKRNKVWPWRLREDARKQPDPQGELKRTKLTWETQQDGESSPSLLDGKAKWKQAQPQRICSKNRTFCRDKIVSHTEGNGKQGGGWRTEKLTRLGRGLIKDHLNKQVPMTLELECQLLMILFWGAKNNIVCYCSKLHLVIF